MNMLFLFQRIQYFLTYLKEILIFYLMMRGRSNKERRIQQNVTSLQRAGGGGGWMNGPTGPNTCLHAIDGAGLRNFTPWVNDASFHNHIKYLIAQTN